MPECCDPGPYRRLFDEKGAAHLLRRYRRKGLDPMAAELVAYLVSRRVDGRTVLEVGGGVGQIQVELLQAGAASAVNVEISDGYEDVAAELLANSGLADRVERKLGDFVEEASHIDPADIVVLNRVICCYPWMERLMDAATSRTRSLLAIAIPRDRWLNHVMVRLDHLANRLKGSGFKSFVHPVDEIDAKARAAGLQLVFTHESLVWRGVVFERA